MTDSVGKILHDLIYAEASAPEKPSLTQCHPDRWMVAAVGLGWPVSRLEDIEEMIVRGKGTVLRTTANVIAFRQGSGQLTRIFREHSTECIRQGEYETRDIPSYVDAKA